MSKGWGSRILGSLGLLCLVLPVWADPIDDFVAQVSPSRIEEHVEFLVGFVTRWSAAQGCFEASAAVADAWSELGYQVTTVTHRADHAPSVIAELPGLVAADGIVILCAHLDDKSEYPEWEAPGADDNASGVAAMWEAVSILAGYPGGFARTLRFIAFTGEEQDRLGSSYYAAGCREEGENIVAVINLDQVGYAASPDEDIDIYSDLLSRFLGERLLGLAGLYLGRAVESFIDARVLYSDHEPFWQEDYRAVLVCESYPFWLYPYYHSLNDTPDKLDYGLIADVARLRSPR